MKIPSLKFIPHLIKGYTVLNWLLIGRNLAYLLGKRKLYEKQLCRLVRKTQLFDGFYYLEINSDVAAKHLDPLYHYAVYGDKEGRRPIPFFDPNYYRTQIKYYPKQQINSLLHYRYVGRYLGLSPSPWFDIDYYLKLNPDVARLGMDPLLHYLKWGGTEGRSPTSQFDGAYYLRSNPDVAESRVNPLSHYLRIGQIEGRATLPSQALVEELSKKPVLSISTEDWQLVSQKQNVLDAKINVVIPVYKDQQLTLRTIYSVLKAKTAISFELIVINDCSPEPELVAMLEQLDNEKLFTLLHNPKNRGFVHTVNRGMQLNPERDVVLLNSDTEVFDHWLDKLYATAYRHPHTGTVTPLSNSATICSYPSFLNDNPHPLELSYSQVDALTAVVNQAIEVEAPTAVGFCMYIRHDCLKAVGLFDEKTFGQGYGEENDFCQRAIAKGWRNILAADTFVWHWGSASFQGEKAERVNAALKALEKLHPDYQARISQFIKQDPLAPARRRLDWARLLAQVKPQNVLIICHNRGGGAWRHVQEDTEHLLREGVGVFFLRPVQGKPTHVRLTHPQCPQIFNLAPFLLADTDTLATSLAELKITRLHTHGLVDFAIDAPEQILKLAQRLQAEFWVDLHDYKVICPRLNLAKQSGLYCGEPDETACNLCCEQEGNDFAATDIQIWRQTHHTVLQQADKIWVPSADMKKRLLRYFPDISFSVSPHEEFDSTNLVLTPPQVEPNSPLRIVVIGAIGKIKGFDILNACAMDAKKRKLPLEFVLLGYSMADKDLSLSGVQISGRYAEAEAQGKLQELIPHVIWLPSLWPETYSYTLSLALNGGYPTFAFDIGAIADRLREIGQEDFLMPLQIQESPQTINDYFVDYLLMLRTSKNVHEKHEKINKKG